MKGLSFSSEMVKAILEGRKIQTRRPIKPQPEFTAHDGVLAFSDQQHIKPKYQPGETVYVKEKWKVCAFGNPPSQGRLRYASDGRETDWILDTGQFKNIQRDLSVAAFWRSPRFMPEWASRQKLLIVSVRAERLNDITLKDIRAEGVEPEGGWAAADIYIRELGTDKQIVLDSMRFKFQSLWDSIYAKTFLWESNPWVFVYTFKRVEE